jgi:uncharacterized protein YbaP (TraB family)
VLQNSKTKNILQMYIVKNKFILLLIVLHFFINSNGQNNNTLLWRIQKKGATERSYLYGKMHFAKKQYAFFYDSTYKAIQESGSFYGELDYFNMSIFSIKNYKDYFKQKELFLDSIAETPGWKRMVLGYNKAYGTNLDYKDKDAFINTMSTQSEKIFEKEEGIVVMDMALAKFAQLFKKKAGGIETLKEQIDMMYSVIAERVNDSTVNFDNDDKLNNNLKKYYLAEQTDSIGFLLDNIDFSYKRILFDDRNSTMKDSITKIMQKETAFVAVGAGHLFGKNGILNKLKKEGYIVTPIFGTKKIYMPLMQAIVKAPANIEKIKQKKEAKDYWKDMPTLPEKVKDN